MENRRTTVAIVSSSRADYGHLYWPFRAMEARETLDPRIITFAGHHVPLYGSTEEAFAADDLPVDARIETQLGSDSRIGMAKSVGVATLGFADALDKMRPDLVFILADRYEMLAPASVCVCLGLPLAHLEGGEVSSRALDEQVRNALTKLSHLHFTPTETSARRVIAMGEEPWRVHPVGAPSIDHLTHSKLPDRRTLEQQLGLSLDEPPLVVSHHPVTLADDPLADARALFAALEQRSAPMVLCFPNADAGSQELIATARTFCASRPNAVLHVNLPHLSYWALLQHGAALVGNSSSGIMEAPSLELPVVNVGERQQGRERSANIIDAPAHGKAIEQAIDQATSKAFGKSLEGMTSAYGDGQAGERIAAVLAELPARQKLLLKAPVPV